MLKQTVRTVRAGLWCLVVMVYSLGTMLACATLDPSSVKTGAITSQQSVLVSAEPFFLKPAGDWQGAISWMSLGILGTMIDTKLLLEMEYDKWRLDRVATINDVQAVVVRFDTQITRGKPDRQSGMLFLPAAQNDRKVVLHWIVWLKGTELLRDLVPSRFAGVETSYAAMLASMGYAVWMPDYAGMGDSPGIHPFCVPESLAFSALDGLQAARNYVRKNSQYYTESGKLFVMGYSEGGLAAMATMRQVMRVPNSIKGLQLVSVFSMGAPLNLSIGFDDIPINDVVLAKPQYCLLMVLGWARAYPRQIKLAAILPPWVITELVPLFDGSRSEDALHAAIASGCKKKIGQVSYSDLFLASFLEKSRLFLDAVPFHRLQTEQRLDRTVPPQFTTLILAASPDDKVVDPLNSYSAYGFLHANYPAAKVRLIHLGSTSHTNAGGEALLFAIQQIDQEVKLSSSRPVGVTK